MSRTVNGEKLFGTVEKGMMKKMLFKAAGFSGVEVLTYCFMSNHFHILVKVPDPNKIKLSDEELVARYSLLYQEDREMRSEERAIRYEPPSPAEISQILKEDGEAAVEMRQSLLVRMHDLSQFVKTFKQRFAIWFNVHRKRFGPLWNERFRSVLIEPRSRALLVVAAYIELNPVRAGLVDDPSKYLHSGYGEASHQKSVRPGLQELVRLCNPTVPDHPKHHLEEYGNYLLGRGSVAKEAQGAVGELGKLAFRPNTEQVEQSHRHGLAPLNRGIILGSFDFVLEKWRNLMGETESDKFRPPRGSLFQGVCSSKRRFWKK